MAAKINIVLVLAMSLMMTPVFAADNEDEKPVAYVLSSSGVVEWRPSPDLGWDRLKSGQWLVKTVVVRTDDNAEAQLLYKDDSKVRIEESEIYNVGSRKTSSRQKKSGMWAMLQRIVDQGISGKVGGVAAVRGGTNEPLDLDTLVPRSGYVMETVTDFKWTEGIGGGPYAVSIKDKSGRILWSSTSDTPSRRIFLSHLPLKRGKSYIWEVSQTNNKDQKPVTASFEWMKEKQENSVRDKREKVIEETKYAPTADKHFALALFYIDNDLFVDAERELLAAAKATGYPQISYKMLLESIYALPVPGGN